MVLNIAINGEINDSLMEHLCKFYSRKQYNLLLMQDQPQKDMEYILNHPLIQQLLIRAYNRNRKPNITGYDLIFWQGSIIDDYHLIQNTKINHNFVKQINRYNPEHDLYITINQTTENIPARYNHHTITANNDDEIFEEIIKTIFDNLPRCNWCGKLFKPTKNNYKYCNRTIKGKKCSEWGWEENNRRNNREYYKRNKETMNEKQKYGLGSKGAYLSGTPETNPLAELEKVRKAKRSVGLKPL